jgi:hypothetical protein
LLEQVFGHYCSFCPSALYAPKAFFQTVRMKKIDSREMIFVKNTTRRISGAFVSVLVIAVAGLIFLTTLLFIDNLQFKQQNKELILQNDSLFSVTPKIKSNLDTLKKKKLKT